MMRLFILMCTMDIRFVLLTQNCWHLSSFSKHTIRDIPLFTVDSSRTSCPSAKCAPAAILLAKMLIFCKHLIVLKHFYSNFSSAFFVCICSAVTFVTYNCLIFLCVVSDI
jgi:hypothetical protein